MAKSTGGFIGQDGINAPDPATGVTGTAGDGQVEVSFTSPTDVGGADINGYRVQDSTGAHGASGSASPVTVTGLTNGTSYTFNVWAINPFGWSSPSDASGAVSPAATPIGLVAGGEVSSAVNTINYVDLSSTGNFSDFGDLTATLYKGGAVSSSTRAVFANGDGTNTMSYVTPQTTGNATDYGDLTINRTEFGSAGNATRGLFMGNADSNSSIDYITIATVGNATDYGDLSLARKQAAGFASPTRAVAAGGTPQGGQDQYRIDYRTISSTGTFIDFGDTIYIRNIDPNGCSSDTRGVYGGGSNNSGANALEYVTIASTGNATNFGDLYSSNLSYGPASTGSNTRGIWAGGSGFGWSSNTVYYIAIASTGNASDFGDLAYSPAYHPTACSSAHGGLS